MKTKILSFLLVIVLLSIYPIYRYVTNAKSFAEAMFGHVSKMGNWTFSSINSNFDGKITIRNINFTPKNRAQGFDIGSIVIKTQPMFLLKSNPNELSYILPETLSISVNSASLNNKSNDIYESLKQKNLWMMLVGYAGSFGCNRENYTSFDDETWNKILQDDQVFNVDFYFSRQSNGGLDVDLILDAENMFSSTWSSTLKSSYNEDQIVIDELLVDKLYYSYLDNGFNLSRNNACIQNYKSSFAAYRLSSAEHVQKYLRVNYSKELPDTLINWYQRVLAPDTEYNAIISLGNKMYVSDFYNSNQIDILESSIVEISTTGNEYIPVNLKEIDYTKIDPDLLISENIKKKEKADIEKQLANKQKHSQMKTTVIRTGSSGTRVIDLNNLNSVINKRVRIKTIRGRPVKGVITNLSQGLLTLNSNFKTGTSTITIPIDKISSVELL